MQLKLGNITLREEMIDWVPSPEGRRETQKHLALAFDCKAPCGDLWMNIAYIHEPTSRNPGLNIINDSQTTGVAGIQRMLLLLEEWRDKKGLEATMAGEARKENR